MIKINTRKTVAIALAAGIMMSLSGCAHWSKSSQNTAIGATAGAAGGAILTGGSTLGVMAGAAVGGLIGHEVSR